MLPPFPDFPAPNPFIADILNTQRADLEAPFPPPFETSCEGGLWRAEGGAAQ